MPRIALACATLFLSGIASAQTGPFPRASGEEITAFLTGAYVESFEGEGASWNQVFYENGSTEFAFTRQRPSVGKWSVERDQYCSQWPPTPTWACYWVEIEGDVIIWEAVETGVREGATLVER